MKKLLGAVIISFTLVYSVSAFAWGLKYSRSCSMMFNYSVLLGLNDATTFKLLLASRYNPDTGKLTHGMRVSNVDFYGIQDYDVKILPDSVCSKNNHIFIHWQGRKSSGYLAGTSIHRTADYTYYSITHGEIIIKQQVYPLHHITLYTKYY